MASPTRPCDHSNVFIESGFILTSNYLHFLTLSFAFFFTLWFSLISLPSVLQTIILSNTFRGSHIIVLALVYALLVFTFTVAGTATITHSSHEAFDHRPLSLFTTIKSLSISFFPLTSTILTFLVCLILICSVPLVLLIYAIKNVEFEIDHGSYYFFLACVLGSIIIGLFLILCQLYCVIASVVSVVESKWGFEPLCQSYYIIKAIRRDSLSFFFRHGIMNLFILLGFSYPYLFFPHSKWSYLDFIQVGLTSIFEAWLLLQFVAASTVLFLHSKNLNCDLPVHSDDQISDEYTRLAMDDNNFLDDSRVDNGSDWSGLMQICLLLVIIVFSLHMIWFNHQKNAIAELF